MYLLLRKSLPGSGLPDRAQEWLRQHPDYVFDRKKNTALQYHHNQTVDEGIGEWTDAYFDRMEALLGLKPARPNGNGFHDEPPVTAPAPRHSAPVRQYSGPPVSAPPTRDAPSWSSGRPMNTRAPLTAAEQEIAVGWELVRKNTQSKRRKCKGLRLPVSYKMDDKPYTIHSDTRVTLSPAARELCKLHGMTEEQMARHLLNQHRLEQAGQIQRPGED